MEIHRHDLVMAAWDDNTIASIPHQGLRELVAQGRVPGIARRDEAHPLATGAPHYTDADIVPIGFVYPYREYGMRVRHPSSVGGGDILRVTTPYELLSIEFGQRTAALRALASISGSFPLGVWGSAAMEIITGLPYTDTLSDVDLLVRGCRSDELSELSREVSAAEATFSIRIDVEVALVNGYGINLKEYLSSSPEVLAKGVSDVILINRDDVESLL